MLKKSILFALFIFLFSVLLFSQSQAVIQGKVIDKDTKDPLPAYITIKDTDYGSSADYDGTFQLILDSTEIQELIVLEVFQLGYKRQEVEARLGKDILIEMELEPLPPHEVVVTADSLVAEETVQATVTLKKMDVYTLPGTAADPIYTTQVLPGVNSLPDSSSMLIRGGSPDEVAYYFDGIEIDNPFLTGSLHEAYFSIFNNQVIDGFRVSTSGFSTKFGDAFSGVMNISVKDFLSLGEGGFGLSIMGLNSYVGLPIKKVGSFVASYNRGHSGLMTKINNRGESEFETEHIFAKLNIRVNKNTSLRILGLRDNYDFSHDSGFESRSRNTIAGFSLTSTLSQNMVSTFTLSRVSHHAAYEIPDTFKENFNDDALQFRWDTSLELEKHYLEFGADIQRRNLDFFFTYDGLHKDPEAKGTRYGFYFSDKFRVTDQVYFTLGARFNALSLKGMKVNFVPRFSLAYFISPKDILRFSVGLHHQYGDYFTLQQNDLRTKKAGHVSLTYDRISDDLDLRVTLYNKEYWSLFLYQGTQINNTGSGFARGAELYIKRKHPKYDVFFVYNYLSSKRREHEVQILTTSPYEISHSLTGIFQYKFKTGTLGIRFSYATGLPYTPLAGREWDEINNVFIPIWGEPYSQRYPSYQRLDVNGSKNVNFHKRLIVFYFGITNLFNRKNILQYEYSSDYSIRSNTYSIFGRTIFVGIYIPFF
ncbi:MAG: TonB-dependent receptor [Candidatus Aminicenantes bacterium]|nr:MAG: TonB-dependent receptor [Candidatus Aminicenantes bacterium]